MKYPQALSSKYTWFQTYYGERLHFLPDADEEGFWEIVVELGEYYTKAICGRWSRYNAPGIAARIVLPRCKRCCDALGIPYGQGTPFNDDSSRKLVEEGI